MLQGLSAIVLLCSMLLTYTVWATPSQNHIQIKKSSAAEETLRNSVKRYPENHQLRIALADYYLYRHRDMWALFTIQNGLRGNASDYELLLKEAEIHKLLHQYALAARSYQRALMIQPNNSKAKCLLTEINELSPNFRKGLNTVGLFSNNAYLANQHNTWDYTTLFYTRDTNYGPFTAMMNYASRLSRGNPQFEVNYALHYNRNSFIDLKASYSREPALFPSYALGAEAYTFLLGRFEISGGLKHSQIESTFFKTWTGSLNFYPGNYWLSFRPLFFVPQKFNRRTKQFSNTSLLYTIKARRYFAKLDHSFTVGVGSGHSPDLADLLNASFIVIKNRAVNLDYSFPIYKSNLVVNLGLGYQYWKYPSGLLREFYDGSIGVKCRF